MIKSYVRGFERLPIDTLRYAASTNYFIACAEALPDFNTFVDVDLEIFNNAVFVHVFYSDTDINTSYLSISGGTMYGNINMGNYNITNINILSAMEVHTISAYTHYQDILISEISGFNVTGNVAITGDINVAGNIIPAVSGMYDLGSPVLPWRDLWLSGSSIHMDGNILSISAGQVSIQNLQLSSISVIPAGQSLTGSDNWDSTYTTVFNNSANWDSSYAKTSGNLPNPVFTPAMVFDQDKIYEAYSLTSPITCTITDAGSYIGKTIMAEISGTNTIRFASGFKKLSTTSYVTTASNYLYFNYIGSNKVLYTISQEQP
jgi:hypothetical protein